jgi:hypothetical protein
MAVLRPS